MSFKLDAQGRWPAGPHRASVTGGGNNTTPSTPKHTAGRTGSVVRKGSENMSISCLNVRGIANKLIEMTEAMRPDGTLQDDIVGIVETHMHTGELLDDIAGFDCECAAAAVRPGLRSRNGVAAWLRHGHALEVVAAHERVMWIRIPSTACNTTFVALVYAPVQGTNSAVVLDFWQRMAEECKQWVSKGDVVVMGDLNGHVGAGGNSNGKHIDEFCAALDFVILNDRWAPGQHTYESGAARTTVDFVLVQRAALHRVVGMSVVDTGVTTDHRAVRLQWHVGRGELLVAGRGKGSRGWKFPRAPDGWDKYRHDSAAAASLWRQRHVQQQHGDSGGTRIERLWNTFFKSTVSVVDACFRKGSAHNNGSRAAGRWKQCDVQLKAMVQQRRSLFNEWQQKKRCASTEEECENADTAHMLYKRVARDVIALSKKRKWHVEQAKFAKLQATHHSDQRAFFSHIKRLRKGGKRDTLPTRVSTSTGNTESEAEGMAAWRAHFESMGRQHDDDVLFDPAFLATVTASVKAAVRNGAPPRSPHSSDLGGVINSKELKRAMAKMRDGKARGPDGVCNEILTKGGAALHDAILDLFNEIWAAEHVPEVWCLAHILPIYKQSGPRSKWPTTAPLRSCVSLPSCMKQ